ncbi:MAG: DMT family transporter [Dehalococcoidia bacterium]
MNRSGPVAATPRLGISLALTAALISGVSIFLNGHAVRHFDDSAVFTAAKNSLVGVVIVAALLRPATMQEARALPRATLLKLGTIAVVGGSIPFILFFEGLSQATAANAAFIQKTLFIWVALLAVPLLGERLGPGHLLAIGVLLLAQVLIGRPAEASFGSGELMILAATLLWAVETVIARQVLRGVSASIGVAARMGGGALVLFCYLAVTGKASDLFGFDAEQWRWLLLTAAFLVAYVSTWYGALKLAPATAVTCVLTVAAPLTAALQIWDGRPMPDAERLAGYSLLMVGVALTAVLAWRAGRDRGQAGALEAAGGGA